MQTHIVGRETSILNEIRAGQKTVEARLAKPRFLAFKVGDHINIREDHLVNGKIVDGELSDVWTEVTKVEKFSSFTELFKHVDYKIVNPQTNSVNESLAIMRQFYTLEQENELGVVAIHFKLYSNN